MIPVPLLHSLCLEHRMTGWANRLNDEPDPGQRHRQTGGRVPTSRGGNQHRRFHVFKPSIKNRQSQLTYVFELAAHRVPSFKNKPRSTGVPKLKEGRRRVDVEQKPLVTRYVLTEQSKDACCNSSTKIGAGPAHVH